MPTFKARAAPDDSRSEASSTKEKAGNGAPTLPASKGRRTVGAAIVNGSSLKDVVTANNVAAAAAAASSNPLNAQEGAGGVSPPPCAYSAPLPLPFLQALR